MDTRRLAEQLKERIPVEEAIRFYSGQFQFGPVKNRRMVCPFHSEKTASLLIHRNGRSWKCYGCGAGGTVIDFVMELFHITFGQACVRLNSDFSLGLTDRRPSPGEERKRRAESFRRRQEEKKKRMALNALCEEYRWLLFVKNNTVWRNADDPALEWYYRQMMRMYQVEELFQIYDFEGEDEWWKSCGYLQKKIS